jgi:hypothetical protein
MFREGTSQVYISFSSLPIFCYLVNSLGELIVSIESLAIGIYQCGMVTILPEVLRDEGGEGKVGGNDHVWQLALEDGHDWVEAEGKEDVGDKKGVVLQQMENTGRGQ